MYSTAENPIYASERSTQADSDNADHFYSTTDSKDNVYSTTDSPAFITGETVGDNSGNIYSTTDEAEHVRMNTATDNAAYADNAVYAATDNPMYGDGHEINSSLTNSSSITNNAMSESVTPLLNTDACSQVLDEKDNEIIAKQGLKQRHRHRYDEVGAIIDSGEGEYNQDNEGYDEVGSVIRLN